MRALLDTNIIIHRENKHVSNYSIGHLYRWLDKLKYDKVIHPYSISEIQKYKDPETQETIAVKLESYDIIKTVKKPDEDFLKAIGVPEKSQNDRIDNYLLYEVYLGRVDILITEDRKLRNKADKLGLGDRVFSINAFISKASVENPALIEYKILAVTKTYFGNVDVKDSFFDSFRKSYSGFDKWFVKKCDEEAYICNNDSGKILGFLYLKTEGLDENYSDIYPPFGPKRRLKVGTFKVESTGFRLGERFMKIIFDNAIQQNVDEIYVTLFTERDELIALADLLIRWGYYQYGTKKSSSGIESVFVKDMRNYEERKTPKENYPKLLYNKQKFILPIEPQYHTTLLPDSKLHNENAVDFMEGIAHRYALQKVYISFSSERNIKSGDFILFYRKGTTSGRKKYESVLTTVGIVDDIAYDFKKREEYFAYCQNRTVFSDEDLFKIWRIHKNDMIVVKFIFVKSLVKKLTLGYLWDTGIVTAPYGPRPFTRISDDQFDKILEDANTDFKY
jgi:hypothetical protein